VNRVTNAVMLAALLASLLTAPAVAQTSPVLPTYVSAGVSFNQIGDPQTNLFLAAVYPIASGAGVFMSTASDISPVKLVNPATKKPYWGFTTTVRQGVHKQLYAAGNWRFLLGGDAGAGFSQADPSGVNVTLAGSFQATAIYRFKPQWAIVAPIGGVYVNGAWNLIPRIGISFKP
jgi:hypothetical protein